MPYTILAIAVVVICWCPIAFLLGWLAHKRKLQRIMARSHACQRPRSGSVWHTPTSRATSSA